MAKTYLIDSNVIIEYISNKLPAEALLKLDNIFNEGFYYSIISSMKVLGYESDSTNELVTLSSFLSLGNSYDVNTLISEKVIALKRSITKKNLPD